MLHIKLKEENAELRIENKHLNRQVERLERIEELYFDELTQLKTKLTLLWDDCQQLKGENKELRKEIETLKTQQNVVAIRPQSPTDAVRKWDGTITTTATTATPIIEAK